MTVDSIIYHKKRERRKEKAKILTEIADLQKFIIVVVKYANLQTARRQEPQRDPHPMIGSYSPTFHPFPPLHISPSNVETRLCVFGFLPARGSQALPRLFLLPPPVCPLRPQASIPLRLLCCVDSPNDLVCPPAPQGQSPPPIPCPPFIPLPSPSREMQRRHANSPRTTRSRSLQLPRGLSFPGPKSRWAATAWW